MAKWQIILAGLVGGTVVIGGAAAYLFLKGIPAIEGTNPISSAKIVPDEALFAGYVSGDTNVWSKLDKFGTPEAKKLVSGGLEQMLSSFDTEVLAAQGINLEKDILPWLGSVMLAVVPNEAESPEPLMVIGIKDKVAALNFANKMKDGEGAKVKETEFKGVTVLEVTEANTPPMFIAILDNHLALSSNRAITEAAISTSKGEPSLASVGDAKQVFAPSVELDNPVAQFYVPNYGDLIKKVSGNSLRQQAALPPQFLEQLEQFQAVAIGVGIDDQGLQMRSRFTLAADTPQWDYKPIPGKVIAEFPADTMALISGGGINQQWTTLLTYFQDNPDFKQGLDIARQQLRQATQLDLDKDVLGWMDGEFALALIPSREGLLSSTGFGGALLLETSDRPAAEKTFGKLDQVAATTLQVKKRDISGTQVTEWQVPVQGALFAHGWLDPQTTFLAVGGPIADVVASKPAQTLKDSAIFKSVTASLPNQNNGYFYVNMEEATKVVEGNVLAAQTGLLQPEAMEIMKSIQGIGAATTQVNDTTYQSDIFIALTKN